MSYGKATDEVLVGKWEGNTSGTEAVIDTLAVRRGNICYIKNSIASGASDMTVAYGKSTDEILVGDWDGDGYDTLCARRGNTCYFQKTIQATVHDRMVRYGKATDELYAGTWN